MSFEQEDLWREAKSLANSRAAMEVIRRIEQRLIDEWSNSDPDKYDARDAAYHLVRAVRTFRDELAALAREPDVTAFNRRLKGDR
jgi:hypothetical protein